jgi:aspartate dehydrogenase
MKDRRAHRRRRIGLIGFGSIGARVYERVSEDAGLGLEIAFVHNRSAARLAAVPSALQLHQLDELDRYDVELVVEMAHPEYTRIWGERILSVADYLPLSVAVLADDALRERLLARARGAGTSLAIRAAGFGKRSLSFDERRISPNGD